MRGTSLNQGTHSPVLVAGAGIFHDYERITLFKWAKETVGLSSIHSGKDAQFSFLSRSIHPGLGNFEFFVDVGQDGGVQF